MAEFWQEVFTRNQQTRAIWNQFDPAFLVGTLSLAQHATDGGALLTAANNRAVAEDVGDDGRDLRNARGAWLTDLCIRFPRAIAGQLAPNDDLLNEVADVQKIVINSPDDIGARGRKVISLVTRFNVARAAAVPPQLELKVKAAMLGDPDVTIAAFTAALTALPGVLLAIEDQKAALNKTRSALQKQTLEVDRNNKRWFVAWEGNFPDGSPERDALSQIDTGPTTPVPSAKLIDQASAQGNGAVGVTYVAGGGAHASVLLLLWKVVGVDNDFAHETVLLLGGQTVSGLPVGATVQFKTRASNSKGHTDSAVKSAVVT